MPLVKNPKTGKFVEATKKGFTSSGNQIFIPKDGSPRFNVPPNRIEYKEAKTNKAKTNKAKSSKSKKESSSKNMNTIIMINGNIFKELEGEINLDTAYSYFSEYNSRITKNDISIINKDKDTIIYTVSLQTGTKG
jgi:hypothetical protein